ncbi:rifamycin-inactivating phosphotransferase [Paractinoplanes maris]|uniref:rifamycin-inactivating phosphotransferase n=1 Tax=Paractinoplanes maris TaxID=1734446 RepID=UPI0020219CEE|nr:rifamycin-inactivating phosphotransferase [Actinoplanes maris]
MTRYVLDLTDIRPDQVALAGGKGANLGELTRIDGVRVPPGFCVTTVAFEQIIDVLDRLPAGAELRRAVREASVPDELAAEITRRVGPGGYAVRSSATAEDLPAASFAGQHDSYLNVVGPEAVLEHIRLCWASLFTDRAISYRLRHGIDHRQVRMAVVVQQMVFPRASGILFTADPVTSDRTVSSVDAGFGLGEALVSGLVNPDVYRVRDGAIISRAVAVKRLAVEPLDAGGTGERAIEPDRREQAALTDAEVLELVGLGQRIEAHFGRPQDIEWCRTGDGFQIVQSRPITTLFPVPGTDDAQNHVYVSVGHQQMMTDPMKPLGISFWQMTTPRPMAVAGGRLFVDVTPMLAAPGSRENLIDALGRSDPLIGGALRTAVEREGFLPPPPDSDRPAWVPPGSSPTLPAADPAVVTELIEQFERALAATEQAIGGLSGSALLDFIRADVPELRRAMQSDPRSLQAIMAGMEASRWLNDHMLEWLGERNVADTLAQSVPHNVTSEMGLALLDVADVIRPHPEVVAFLHRVEDDDFLDELAALPGGQEARDAIRAFLDRYGMRCVGEIDITRPRWSEQPTALVPLILGNVRNFEPGAHERLFEQGRRQAEAKRADLLARLKPEQAAETAAMIDRVRTFSGYREYPKYHMISRYLVYKRALTAEAGRMVAAGLIDDREDIFFLSFDELGDAGRARERIGERKEAYASYLALTPPRVFTSDGEVLTAGYGHADLPAGALAGLPVSSGTVEGRARVLRDLATAELEPGDILVTAYTDPSWTPVFVTIAGLVTEVGGLMTHGAVIAREYGLPAVVGVERATTLIRDGQRIRVHGTDGYVEILTDEGFPSIAT